ncbi:putative sulfonate biosynthesis enzyme [Jackrogersella minutella]|nr:putative sulfonate biosynthesis enzyme [Jackrogersella minutella]
MTFYHPDRDGGFGFARHNPAPPKPRARGVTEIRGPYYTAMGPRYLGDVLETTGAHVDGLKFAGGSLSLTGGWIEHVLASGDVGAAVDRYLDRCKDLGFDVVELSAGFLSLPPDDWMRLAERSIGTSDPSKVIHMAKRFVRDAGVERVMIESEGITENVKTWRTHVIQSILRELPMEKVMFEAADPSVFNCEIRELTIGKYIREFGIDVNLFVDHSQIVQLAGLRAGIWGKSDTFGKITTFRP